MTINTISTETNYVCINNSTKKERPSKPFFLNVNILRVLWCQNNSRNNKNYLIVTAVLPKHGSRFLAKICAGLG